MLLCVCVYIYMCVCVMIRMDFLGRFLIVVATIRSCPGALCGLHRFIALFISTGVKALTGRDSSQGTFK
jgi:hypothetical protein